MYKLNDTIAAISSPTPDEKVIIRIAGPDTIKILQQIFSPSISCKTVLVHGSVAVDRQLKIDARLYLFKAPYSYTGDDLAEIHIITNHSVTEALMETLLTRKRRTSFAEYHDDQSIQLRLAGPGEFTARAYLNGKIDLAQAEAVCEIIASSNKFQLAAAEKLLAGRLAGTSAQIRSAIIDCLSSIEAGLDFSQDDIEFITTEEAIRTLNEIKKKLQQLLSGNISYEALIDLLAVGIAGAPNAGKSSLLNKLLGRARSIVSNQCKTTVDVLTGTLTLRHCRIVLFDCAGLTTKPENILEELAQAAAIEALQNSSVVIFCVDISKTDWSEDVAIRKLIEPNPANIVMIPVATKSDLLSEDLLSERISELNKLFGANFLIISAPVGMGIEHLKDKIGNTAIELLLGCEKHNAAHGIQDTKHEIALTARHRNAVNKAIENIIEAIDELKSGNDEVAVMVLRAAYQAITNIEQENIEDQVLKQIFQRFCIGK